MILPISPLPHAHSLLFESLLLLNFKTTARRRETKQKYKKNKKVYKKADTHRNLKCKNNDDDDNDGDAITFEVTRSDFERVNAVMFDKVLHPLVKVLEESEMDKSQVDEIVLVGGSTRIPKVREMLKAFTGKEPCSSIDPDEAVAVGVAMQAGILAGAWPLQVSALEIPFERRKIELD
eukprot:m.190487 g.190487  ORF g.190487 m.190487 type:complete len:178 (+) comp32405_c11_seq2:211-744(+)